MFRRRLGHAQVRIKFTKKYILKYFHLNMFFFETDCEPENGLASAETCCYIEQNRI